MRSFIIIFYPFIFVLLSNNAFSQYEFIENKGQWHDNVKYKLELGNGAVFLENHCLTYNFISPEDDGTVVYKNAHGYSPELTRKGHAFRVVFQNSNKPEFVEENAASDYCNYFIGNDPSKWASSVRKYEKISYSNIYDGIDLVYYNTENGLKYDFIIHPGGNTRDIMMEYEGADMLYLEGGEFHIATSISLVKEGKPFAYQIINGDTVSIPCNYYFKNNRLGFNISKSYDKAKDLVIDPSLVFSTYSGSLGDNWGFTATWDYAGNVYSGGIVFEVGYPTTTGAYQVNFAGGVGPHPGNPYYSSGCDIGIIKFNETGTQRIYATYLGGSTGQEMPHSLVVTEKNDLVIMGTTGSSDFPTTTGAFSRTFSGGDSLVYDNIIAFAQGVDIFVAKLSEDGSRLLGSTYMGGSANDGLNFKRYYTYPDPVTRINYVEQHGNDSLYFNYGDGARGELIVDKNDMIYVGTNTFSSDFPSGISQGYQNSNAGGQEGIVFKLSPDMSQLLWSSYLGGDEDDAVFSICMDNAGDIIVTGGTTSHNFPVTPGAYNTTYNGGTTDAFVSKLNPAGNTLMSSTYFGSDRYDNAYFVRTDINNNIFICGQTKATGNTLIRNVLYSIPNSGQFITRFNPDLTDVDWSTVFGTGNGRPNISITAFAVDVCNRIYLSGWGREWANYPYNAQGSSFRWTSEFGTKGMQVTPDAIQPDTDGQDFYILVLSENASRLEYATFFGEQHSDMCSASGRDHVDGGTARFDKQGHIIQSVCASCSSGSCSSFPTTSGSWSEINRSYNCNDAVFKIRIIENLVNASFDPVPVGCAPYNVQFHNNSSGLFYQWDFGDGTTSAEYNPQHIYTEGGDYTVRLIVTEPSSCNFADTIIRVVRVVEPGVTNLPDIVICPGENILIGPSTEYAEGTSFSWSGGGLSNYNIQNPVASPTVTTSYRLIASGICNDTILQKVIVKDVGVDIYTSSDTTICSGGSAILSAWSTGEVASWEWSDNFSFTNILSYTEVLNVSPLSTTTYYVRATESECNISTVEQVTVNLHRFNYTLIPRRVLCSGSSINLTITNNDPFDDLSYSWQPLSMIISGADTNSPLVNPSQPATFTVTITSSLGCVTVDEVYVDIETVEFGTPELIHNLCFGQCQGMATVTATGQNTYLWSNGMSGETVTGLCAGSYTVTATSVNNCFAESNITISEPAELGGSFTDVVFPQCDGIGYGSATFTANGGVPGYTYQWSYGGGNGPVNNRCLVGINTVTVTDVNNCISVNTIDMPSPSTLTCDITSYRMVSCYGYCDGSITVEARMGLPPYEYRWSGGMNGSHISGLCPGTYVVTVIDNENCVYHNHMQITEPDSLVAEAFVESPILCYGATGNIGVNINGGTGQYSHLWSDNSTGQLLENVTEGTYSVTITDANLCKAESNVTITQPGQFVLTTTLKDMICNNNCNGEINARVEGGTSPYTFIWSNGVVGENNANLCEGEYQLTVRDKNNCIIKEDFYINNEGYVPDLRVDASSVEIFAGETVALSAYSTRNGSYLWDNSHYLDNKRISNPKATPLAETLFTVVFTADNKCVAIDTIRIKVKEVICKDPYIFVPTAFTPNDDGKNDYFKPFYPDSMVNSVYFAVYDRWGNVMYESDKLYDKGWDGTYRGEKLASDVYVFLLRAKCLNGEEYKYEGNVTLLR